MLGGVRAYSGLGLLSVVWASLRRCEQAKSKHVKGCLVALRQQASPHGKRERGFGQRKELVGGRRAVGGRANARESRSRWNGLLCLAGAVEKQIMHR